MTFGDDLSWKGVPIHLYSHAIDAQAFTNAIIAVLHGKLRGVLYN